MLSQAQEKPPRPLNYRERLGGCVYLRDATAMLPLFFVEVFFNFAPNNVGKQTSSDYLKDFQKVFHLLSPPNSSLYGGGNRDYFISVKNFCQRTCKLRRGVVIFQREIDK